MLQSTAEVQDRPRSAAGEKEVLAVTFPRSDLFYKPACTPLPVSTASVKPPPQVLVSSLHTPG